MNAIQRRRLAKRKRKIQRRLAQRAPAPRPEPRFTARNIQYEVAERTHGMGQGGIGAFHLLARKLGLIQALDDQLLLLKFHFPYHESVHVLNIAYNNHWGGTCLEDLELRRSHEVYLDVLGSQRIPDPTTAGDFCRRFTAADIMSLQAVFDPARLRVWRQQPAAFFAEAVLDMDGSLVETNGRCKEGMDIASDRTWGSHPWSSPWLTPARCFGS